MRQVSKIFLSIAFLVCAGLVACGDDSSSSVLEAPEDEISSSSVSEESSSSRENVSSSSEESSSSSVGSSESDIPEEDPLIRTSVVEDTFEIFTFGSVSFDIAADSFLTKFDYGDFVTVMVAGYDTLDVPVVPGYGYVFPGEFLLLVSSGVNYITLGANYGEMAEIIGLGRDLEFPIEVVIQMKERGGYLDHLENLSSLSMSFYAEAYPDLTVEQFANFRMVRTTGMGEGKLYRSSSPVDPSIGRNTYADSLAEVAGVKTFVNLADNEEYANTYTGFAESYYATQNVVYLDVLPGFANTPFKAGLVKGLRFMIEHEGPYLAHCTYGMDRTGYTIAVLEALMGATAEEIRADYVTTHKNFYSFAEGGHVDLTPKQVSLIQAIIVRLMRNAYKVENVDISDFDNVDLAAATEKYLLSLGMEQSEIDALKNCLK